MAKIALGILILGLSMIACDQDSISPEENPPIMDEVIQDVTLPSTQPFSWRLLQTTLQQESAEEDKNVVISPLSISTALYMTYNGAKGSTQEAIGNTLELNGMSADSLNAAYRTLMKVFDASEEGVHLELANALFWDKSKLTPHESFLEELTTKYQAEAFEENFQSNPDAVIDKINSWVAENTEDRITKILESLSPDEVLFIVNALYFLGDWHLPFPEETTEDRPFTLKNGEQIMVPTMFQDNAFRFYQGDDLSIVESDLVDTSFTMWFMLPPEELSVEQWLAEKSMDWDLSAFSDKLTYGRIFLEVPKFEVNYKINLNEVLKSMGMDIAFNESLADFSNIGDAGGNIFISRVEHKTFLKVDEKGVEGAAVTSVGFGVTSVPPTIRFDRPFLVLLMHKPTQTLIFMGKIEHPLQD